MTRVTSPAASATGLLAPRRIPRAGERRNLPCNLIAGCSSERARARACV